MANTADQCSFDRLPARSSIARETGLSRLAILLIRDTPEAAEAALCRWGM